MIQNAARNYHSTAQLIFHIYDLLVLTSEVSIFTPV